MDRNLVLLLASGHTVRIALKPDDLTDRVVNIDKVDRFLVDLPTIAVSPFQGSRTAPDRMHIVMAFIEDTTSATVGEEPNEFQRIDAYAPGDNL